VALLVAGHPVGAQEGLSCRACVIVDESGRVLFARAARAARANASTTKIVTALVVRDHTTTDEVVTVSPVAAGTTGGGLDLAPGEHYRVEDLLYALLLTSSNQAAVALAEHVAGSEAAFVEMMNRTALSLGATSTRFVTAHGLDVPGHYSSPRDLARFALELLEDPLLAAIVADPQTSIASPRGRVILENRNVLLEGYRGATGVKTGYTARAGDVLVASATRGDRSLVAVTMGATSDEAAAREAAALLDKGWNLLARTEVLAGGRPIATLIFDPAGATDVIIERGVRGPWLASALEVAFEPDPRVRPPLVAGETVGRAVVRADGRVVASVPAIARSGIPAPPRSWGQSLLTAVLSLFGGLVEQVTE